MMTMSQCIFTTMPISIYSFNTRCYPRKNGAQRQTRRAGGVERGPSRGPVCLVPVMAGDRKKCKPQHDHLFDCMYQQPLLQELLVYCCTWWLGRLWVGGCGCVGMPAVAMLFGPLVLHRTMQLNTPPCFVLGRCCTRTYVLLHFCAWRVMGGSMGWREGGWVGEWMVVCWGR